MIPRTISRNFCVRKVLLNQAYARSYATSQVGPNHAIIELLNHYKEQEDTSSTRNAFKVRAFQSAIKVINQLDHPLRSVEEARSLKGVGPGITQRIELYLNGQNYGDDPKISAETLVQQKLRTTAVTALQLVSGIGPARARQLVDAGCMDIPSMHKPQYQDMLSNAQKIGLKYFHHLQMPVTRTESENAVDFIRDNISSKFEVHVGGSYRRGHTLSSDIDIILFHPSHVHIPTPAMPPPSASVKAKGKGRARVPFTSAKASKAALESSPLVQDVVKPLEERGFLAASLSSGARKWQGVILLPAREDGDGGPWEERRVRLEKIEKGEGHYRRMDINLVPMKSRGAALLALTGDTEFNRDIRTRAITLGLHLNEFGLWRWQPDENGHSEESVEKGYWELVKAETEEEILREVGMEWVEPEKRNFEFVVGKMSAKGKGRPKKT